MFGFLSDVHGDDVVRERKGYATLATHRQHPPSFLSSVHRKDAHVREMTPKMRLCPLLTQKSLSKTRSVVVSARRKARAKSRASGDSEGLLLESAGHHVAD